MFAGTGGWEFLTAGWGDRPNASGSWRLSLNELITGAMTGDYNMHMAEGGWGTRANPVWDAVQKNFKDNGFRSIATIALAGPGVKLIRRLARPTITDANKLLKATGISQATGLKV